MSKVVVSFMPTVDLETNLPVEAYHVNGNWYIFEDDAYCEGDTAQFDVEVAERLATPFGQAISKVCPDEDAVMRFGVSMQKVTKTYETEMEVD